MNEINLDFENFLHDRCVKHGGAAVGKNQELLDEVVDRLMGDDFFRNVCKVTVRLGGCAMNDFEDYFYEQCSIYTSELVGPNAYEWDGVHERLMEDDVYREACLIKFNMEHMS